MGLSLVEKVGTLNEGTMYKHVTTRFATWLESCLWVSEHLKS